MKNSNLIVKLFNNLKTKDSRDVVITFHNIMPDDFELKEEDIWPLDERPDTEEDANKEN